MAPRTKERFDQDMSGKLEGIGARLLKKGIYTEIFDVSLRAGDLTPAPALLAKRESDSGYHQVLIWYSCLYRSRVTNSSPCDSYAK